MSSVNRLAEYIKRNKDVEGQKEYIETLYDGLILPKPYLSVSQIKSYIICPKAYEYLYILGREFVSNIPMIKGTSEHEVYEEVYQQKINEVEQFTPSIASEFAVTRLEENAEKDNVRLDGAAKDTVIQQITKEVAKYVDVVVPTIDPLFTEQEVRCTLRSGIPFLGYIDLIHIGEECEESIVDYKISAKKWTMNKAIGELQFQVYAMLTGTKNMGVHNITPEVTRKVKKKKPNEPGVIDIDNIRLIDFKAQFNENHINTLIERVACGISMGSFPPCLPDSWKCSEAFCSFYKECHS